MKVLIAPDSFKESLSAAQVCDCIEAGFKQVFTDAEFRKLPLADGGEGTLEALLQSLDGEIRYVDVIGPMGKPVTAKWALLKDKNADGAKSGSKRKALIEIASASGLDLVPEPERNPELATTFGSGELIRDALDAGVDSILLGLGGSATNDGGAGILQALGVKLLDSDGKEIPRGGLSLSEFCYIDASEMHPRCREVKLEVACDVSNPLCGENGASHVFGPQKGATLEMVKSLDASLGHFADVIESFTGVNYKLAPGYGAAGGTLLGLSLAFEPKVQSGIELVMDTVKADEALNDIDLVITGEGRMDDQTLQGKTPYGIAKRAKERGIPVIAIAGSLGKETEKLYEVFDGVFGTVRAPMPLSEVLLEAENNLTVSARNIASAIKLGKSFS
ncbi:glycerate kinase [Vibrio sp. HN007]|uniref:glycerate kinase n=1 Tax=Vibrio iocasae TaxID=3098914 RepID=UPI0035D4872D